MTGADGDCAAVNGTYSVNLPFFCMLSNGVNQGPCTWQITKGPDYPFVQLQYAPAAYFPFVPDGDRWQLLVAHSVTGAFLTNPGFPSSLVCYISDAVDKYVLYGTNPLSGVGDCAGTIELTIS